MILHPLYIWVRIRPIWKMGKVTKIIRDPIDPENCTKNITTKAGLRTCLAWSRKKTLANVKFACLVWSSRALCVVKDLPQVKHLTFSWCPGATPGCEATWTLLLAGCKVIWTLVSVCEGNRALLLLAGWDSTVILLLLTGCDGLSAWREETRTFLLAWHEGTKAALLIAGWDGNRMLLLWVCCDWTNTKLLAG